ncbi:MAG: YdeI/OmpD-associated family protein [Candidatus Kryptoniota bacterium]
MTGNKKDSPTKDKTKIVSFESPEEWERWLELNHDTSNGIWMRFLKIGDPVRGKKSIKKAFTHDEALDVALCYGWIDGQLKPYDEKSWLQKFTPRRAKSIWSKRNADHVIRLIKLGRMKPAGLKQVEESKADGRWEKAYDSPGEMTIPDDFLKGLSKNKKAKAFFETLNRANIYSIAWRLQTAQRPEMREKRMKTILEMLARGEKFH